MKSLHYLDLLAEAFRCHMHHCYITPGPPSIDNAYDTEKLLLKTRVCEDFA